MVGFSSDAEGRGSHPASLSRRSFLRDGARGAGLLGLGLLAGGGVATRARAQGCDADLFGPLLPADANGLMLPAGFTSRVVATSHQLVPGTSHVWHGDPDGGATFATQDGGWIYVSNKEQSAPNGGVAAIRFDADGSVVAAYPILSGTGRNCAGGPTPWGTWLSCEEIPLGRVFECDPFTPGSQGVACPALGRFMHEAAAVAGSRVYLTEDQPDGLLYRFTPEGGQPSLASGVLEAAQILDPGGDGPIAPGELRPLAWHVVPDPLFQLGVPTRDQVPAATLFNGGEGCWSAGGGVVYFTTKGNDRVWRIDAVSNTIEILYDRVSASDPQLSGVDNVTVAPCGDVYVAEDPGNLQIVALTASGGVRPIVQVANTPGSEITGPAFSPDGKRLYFSSQRNPGRTYEVTGPFVPMHPILNVPFAWSALLGVSLGVAGALALWRARAGVAGSDR